MSAPNQNALMEQFLASLETLIGTIRAAIRDYKLHGHPEYGIAYSKWKDTALRFLSEDLDAASAHISTNVVPREVASIAENEVSLGKKLDSFNYSFAGESFARSLNSGVEAVVIAASRLLESFKSGTSA